MKKSYKKSFQTEFNVFKENYINKKAEKMTSDYAFVKGTTLEIIAEYADLFNVFLEKNKKKNWFFCRKHKKRFKQC